MAESRLVPCNLLAWPAIRDLLPDQKLLVYHMWVTCPSAAGCFLLDYAGFQGALSIMANAVEDAVMEFERRGLIAYDRTTGEVFILAWFRWHKFDTATRRRLLEDALKKVESPHLKTMILEKSMVYVSREGKEREGNKEAAAPRASAESVAARKSAAAAPIDSVRNPMPPASGGDKRRRVRPSGLVTWTPDDEAEAERLEANQTAEDVAEAVFGLLSAGKQPVPGLVSREIERIVAQRAAEERRQLAEAERQARLAAGPPPDPEAEARGRAFIASIAQKRRLALQGGG